MCCSWGTAAHLRGTVSLHDANEIQDRSETMRHAEASQQHGGAAAHLRSAVSLHGHDEVQDDGSQAADGKAIGQEQDAGIPACHCFSQKDWSCQLCLHTLAALDGSCLHM